MIKLFVFFMKIGGETYHFMHLRASELPLAPGEMFLVRVSSPRPIPTIVAKEAMASAEASVSSAKFSAQQFLAVKCADILKFVYLFGRGIDTVAIELITMVSPGPSAPLYITQLPSVVEKERRK